ncbi:MAG: hypothetical protein EOO62_21740, partial [Hymenobacter sp.]
MTRSTPAFRPAADLTWEEMAPGVRRQMRVRWWQNPATATYDTYYLEDLAELRGQPVELTKL